MAALETVGAVKGLVYDSVFKRAQEISASDKLRKVEFEGDNLSKGSAECIGSSPADVYVVSVSIDGGSSEAAAAVGQCSCPAGKNAKSGLCKHVVALLLRRTKEALPKANKSSQEEVISVASHEEYDVPAARQDSGGTVAQTEATLQPSRTSSNGAAFQSVRSRSSTAKRVLPAWMLGVVGSAAAAQGESSTSTKSKKRAAAPKPPRPPPTPTKRAKRSGQPLKISNAYEDEGAEGFGEVEDAGPMEEGSAPVSVEDCEVSEPMPPLTAGAAARERRRLRSKQKEKEDVEASGKGDGHRGSKGRQSRSVTGPVGDQPVRAGRGRRLVKKVVEEESDVSENEAAAADGGEDGNDAGIGLDLTDEDLLLLAQEQVESEIAAKQPADSRRNAQAELEKRGPDKLKQGKHSSIFSMDKWKEFSSEVPGLGTSKEYSDGANAHNNIHVAVGRFEPEDNSRGVSASVQEAQVPPQASLELNDIPMSLETDEADAVANGMLDLMFGSSLSRSLPTEDVPVASTPKTSHEDINSRSDSAGFVAPNDILDLIMGTSLSAGVPADNVLATDSVGFVAPTPFSSTESFDVAAARKDFDDLSVESKPKKKSSLRDKVKMFMT